nr:hypothetical protein [Bifidobacterium bombi]
MLRLLHAAVAVDFPVTQVELRSEHDVITEGVDGFTYQLLVVFGMELLFAIAFGGIEQGATEIIR